MTFTVIDRKTGKEPTSRVIDHIAKKGGLMDMDIDQFFLGEDGSLVLADECGNRTYCNTEKFEVIAEQEPQTDKDCISRENLLKKCVYAPIAPVIKGDSVHYEDIVFARDIINAEPIQQEPKAVSIPEGATNGDVFKIMFNKTFPKTIILYKNDESRLTINPMFAREWWEMPYKESEE